jgi:hypothetical protein
MFSDRKKKISASLSFRTISEYIVMQIVNICNEIQMGFLGNLPIFIILFTIVFPIYFHVIDRARGSYV